MMGPTSLVYKRARCVGGGRDAGAQARFKAYVVCWRGGMQGRKHVSRRHHAGVQARRAVNTGGRAGGGAACSLRMLREAVATQGLGGKRYAHAEMECCDTTPPVAHVAGLQPTTFGSHRTPTTSASPPATTSCSRPSAWVCHAGRSVTRRWVRAPTPCCGTRLASRTFRALRISP
eukprot:136668-Chlamydomonas_euryale.AAC.5